MYFIHKNQRISNMNNNKQQKRGYQKKKETLYSWLWKKIRHTEPPYYYYYSLWAIITKPIRKWFSAVFIPTIPFANLRILCYRLCGYRIGKNVFIGMRCYLDDKRYECLEIEDNVGISYGVYMASHGVGHHPHNIIVRDGANISSRATILAVSDIVIGRRAIVGGGTVIRKNVPPYAIVIGNPGKVIGFSMTPEEIVEFEKNNYPEEDRIPIETLHNNYKKYFVDRLKEIKQFIR